MTCPRIMRIATLIVTLAMLTMLTSDVRADDNDLKVFGYFQSEFHQESDSGVSSNTFLLQQLNLFFQKDLAKDWNSFVNIEIVNSFSTSRNWGSLNLEEAWVSYRSSDQFRLKLGLHIPEFNNLNTIKNRTPLLPYVIRPFAYETSFGEFFNLEFVTPQRAYAALYGTIPSHRLKIDYSTYVGNSANVRTVTQVLSIDDESAPQSGTDTTDFLMFGGRLGLRYEGLKAGISGTFEKLNSASEYAQIFSQAESNYRGMPLHRFGADLSYYWKDFVFESEYISAKIDRDFDIGLKIELEFYYVTVGYYVNEYLFLYGTLSTLDINDFGIREEITPPADTNYVGYRTKTNVDLPYIGFSYNINSRVTVKGQAMLVSLESKAFDIGSSSAYAENKRDINRFAVAISAFF